MDYANWLSCHGYFCWTTCCRNPSVIPSDIKYTRTTQNWTKAKPIFSSLSCLIEVQHLVTCNHFFGRKFVKSAKVLPLQWLKTHKWKENQAPWPWINIKAEKRIIIFLRDLSLDTDHEIVLWKISKMSRKEEPELSQDQTVLWTFSLCLRVPGSEDQVPALMWFPYYWAK